MKYANKLKIKNFIKRKVCNVGFDKTLNYIIKITDFQFLSEEYLRIFCAKLLDKTIIILIDTKQSATSSTSSLSSDDRNIIERMWPILKSFNYCLQRQLTQRPLWLRSMNNSTIWIGSCNELQTAFVERTKNGICTFKMVRKISVHCERMWQLVEWHTISLSFPEFTPLPHHSILQPWLRKQTFHMPAFFTISQGEREKNRAVYADGE